MVPGKQFVTSDFEQLTAWATTRLARNKLVRRRLPGGGRIHIDRQLPFLLVCRPHMAPLEEGTADLITTEASYVIASSEPERQADVRELCRQLTAALREVFDQVLLIEIWAKAVAETPYHDWEEPCPAFRVIAGEHSGSTMTAQVLQEALGETHVGRRKTKVSFTAEPEIAPPGLPPLLTAAECTALGALFLGIEIDPIYRDWRTGTVFPLLLRALRPQIGRALKRAACAFAGFDTAQPPRHFESLGRRAMVRAVGDCDRQLSQVAESFDFLLLVTPINAESAWRQFREEGFQQEPLFEYRALPVDPDVLKRRLFALPLEDIEDPTLGRLLRRKQHELDGQITMLRERGTRRFLLTGLTVYGEVDDALLGMARRILDELPPKPVQADSESDVVGLIDAPAFARRAQAEIESYHRVDPNFYAQVEVTSEIPTGIMVAQQRLLIAKNFHTTSDRMEALIHHEVGTHLVTAHNGRTQPLQLMGHGMAGYEPLQEGLAVFAEYLTGGLSRARMRVLAARVIAGHALTRGATFVDTFRELCDRYGFSSHAAFTIAMRVFRGGGLTKDILYLRGLSHVLEYWQVHRELEPLFAGKFGLEDALYIQELRRREIVQPPALEPRYMKLLEARRRLENSHGLTTFDLVRECIA
jgi:uncharacterized protein (TIGR02421 family)